MYDADVFIFMKSMKIDFYFVKSRTYFMNYVWQNLKYFFFFNIFDNFEYTLLYVIFAELIKVSF